MGISSSVCPPSLWVASESWDLVSAPSRRSGHSCFPWLLFFIGASSSAKRKRRRLRWVGREEKARGREKQEPTTLAWVKEGWERD